MVTDMKKNLIPVLIISGLIVVILIFMGISAIIEKNTPTTERADLSEYYNLTEDSQVAIVMDDVLRETQATLIDGQVYLDYAFVYENINNRFYWDSKENILLYTTASDVISAKAEATGYAVGKSTTEFGSVIVKATADSALVNLEFVKQFSNIASTYYEEPSRVVITSEWKDISVAEVKNDDAIRIESGIKKLILSDVSKGDRLTILDDEGSWYQVATTDGIIGYISSKSLKKAESETLISTFEEEKFSHIKTEKPINLLWHQVTNATANSNIATVLSKSKGVNVVSPTWFKVKDNSGNISSIASSDYVEYCHSHNVEVWGLISNFEDKNVSTTELLTRTSSRQNLVNQLIAKALQYNLDGINVDFESMNGPEVGDAYIQFLRELSIKCEDNDIILSTDVPAPAAYNDFYSYGEQANFVDYVIFMGYDEHYGQESGEGSVASLNWTEEAIKTMIEDGLPADQIVLGMPFYTKLWKLTPTTDEEEAAMTYVIGFENKGMTSAKKWMDSHIEEPEFLEDCGQYYGECTIDGVIYKMWLEDTTSLELRLKQMQEYTLAGAAFWKSGLESEDAWNVIQKYIN